MLRSDLMRTVDDFAEDTEWGFILLELQKFLKAECKLDIRAERSFYIPVTHYAGSKYVGSIEWEKLITALLNKSFTERSSRKSGSLLKHTKIHNTTQILAYDRARAYARLFVEIEEDFETLKNSGLVTPNCGYAILKFLRFQSEPLCLAQFERRIVHRLAEIDLIIAKNGGYILHPHAKAGLEAAEDIMKDVLLWPHRCNWILPPRNLPPDESE